MKNFKPLLILSVIGLFILHSCTTIKPLGTISTKEANDMEELFKQTRATIINNQLDYKDTREVWFSLDRMKQYIAYVESEAKKKDYSNLGLRVYYGAYSTNVDSIPTLSTIFFVPTTNSNKIQQRQMVIARPSIPSPTSNPSSAENENIYDIDALNYGGLGHPPKDYSPND